MGATEPVRHVVEPLITAAGLELWDIEQRPGVLRILVDRQGGVDLDTIGRVSEDLSRLLDTHDVGPEGRYLLEVSSPGVERALRTPEQYRRFLGEEVAVKTTVAVDGARRFQGVLLAADDTGIVVATGDWPSDAGRRFDYQDVQQAHTVLVWGPAPKPGRRGGRSARSAAARGAAPAAARSAAPIKDSAP